MNRRIMWLLELPGNAIAPVYSSYSTHPTDHTSRGNEYFSPKITSGAR